MADAFVSTTTLSAQVLSSVDQYVRAALRHSPTHRGLVDTRPVQVDRPGSSVALYIRGDLAPSTTPLSETVDPDAVALPNPTPVPLTPQEYGNATIATIKVKATSFADIDPEQMDAVAWNMRDSLDDLVKAVANGGTNIRYAGGVAGPANTLTDADVIKTADVRYIVTKLRSAAAQPRAGELYQALIHPDVSHDLKAEVGSGGFEELHKYAAPNVFWPNTIGVYQGCFFQESARAKVETDGASSAPVYRTLFTGREAIAEGVQIEPHTVVGNMPDKFGRFFPLGWYGFLGWTVFRQPALWRLESGSSMNA